jgi:hypothetical protein
VGYLLVRGVNLRDQAAPAVLRVSP